MGELRNIIGKVSSNQSVFIPNISILDKVLVVNEIVDFAHINKKGLLAFKVDFEKAFDLVSWDYILYLIKRMNFGSRWLN